MDPTTNPEEPRVTEEATSNPLRSPTNDQDPALGSRYSRSEIAALDERRCERIAKNFRIEPFSGSNTNAIDSGAATWFMRFEALLEMHQDPNGVLLPERMRNALFFQNRDGVASQWYIANAQHLRHRSLESLGRAFKREFGSKLPKLQIGLKVASERKKPEESYQTFSLRLRNMAAAATVEGTETNESNNMALSGFVENAWPKQTSLLKMVIREDSSQPLRELDRAISRLCSLAGHQGVLPNVRPSTSLTRYSGTETNHSKSAGKRTMPREPSEQRTKFQRRDYSKERCNKCGKLGHTTEYHERFVVRQQAGMAHAACTVAAIAAQTPEQTQQSDVEDATNADDLRAHT